MAPPASTSARKAALSSGFVAPCRRQSVPLVGEIRAPLNRTELEILKGLGVSFFEGTPFSVALKESPRENVLGSFTTGHE